VYDGPGGAASPEGASGSILGWGYQVVLPPWELTNLTAVAGGDYHSLGVKADGSIVAW